MTTQHDTTRRISIEVLENATGHEAALAGRHAFQSDIDAVASNSAVATMLESVCAATGMRFAAVTRVTADHWVTCAVVDNLSFGLLPGDELAVDSTLCKAVRATRSEIVIDDVQGDVAYRDHPTPRQYGFSSYLSFPIYRNDGTVFGTLCAIDPKPNHLIESRALEMVRLFARLIGESLDAGERLREVRNDLSHERELSDVQEQFMAIVAHDLRNPLAALGAGLRMVSKRVDDKPLNDVVALMDRSIVRMSGLIDNLMDHARNRLGGGISLDRTDYATLGASLQQIIAELQTVSPDQEIEASIDLPRPVNCDGARISQLLSNLLGNAVTHGDPDKPIVVRAALEGASFVLSVRNQGNPIPAEFLPDLFRPFQAGRHRPSREGLGLGLYIANEIAVAHGGTLDVASGESTIFTFRMPA